MKESTQVLIAYVVFMLIILATILWSFGQACINTYENETLPTDEVPIEVNCDSLDWETFTKALIWVESRGDSKAVGSKDDVGVLQITPILVEDCNRILKNEGFTLEDRLDSLKSVEMFNIIQDHYNPQHDYHWALKLWNSGAPLSYHRKVMDKFNEIKNTTR